MDYQNVVRGFRANKNQLLKYGFIEKEGSFFFEKSLKEENFKVVIQYDQRHFLVNVYDQSFGDEYILFGVKEAGGFAGLIKDEVDTLVKDIKEKCFEENSHQKKILEYVKQHYQAILERPWEDMPEYVTFKTPKSHKWFGIIMRIPAKTLNLKGDKVDIMNVKLDPEKILQLINGKTYFPAYHMNKKYWITILIEDVVIEEIFKLLDESFSLTEK